jgi:hypothetical protein
MGSAPAVRSRPASRLAHSTCDEPLVVGVLVPLSGLAVVDPHPCLKWNDLRVSLIDVQKQKDTKKVAMLKFLCPLSSV